MAMPPPGPSMIPYDPQQHFNMVSPHQGPPPHQAFPPNKSIVPRKRKKLDEHERPEPRRLKRTYESCARCRSKKIKCDNYSPRCKNCQDANVDCQQEDRANKILKPRGYDDLLKAQLNVCVALLQKRDPHFDLTKLKFYIPRESLEVHPDDQDVLRKAEEIAEGLNPEPGPFGYPRPRTRPAPLHPTEEFGPHVSQYEEPEYALPYINPDPLDPTTPGGRPATGAPPRFHHPYPGDIQPVGIPGGPGEDLRGQDPRGNDLSTGAAAARSFGVDKLLTVVPPVPVPRTISDSDPVVDEVFRGRDSGDDPALNSPISPGQWLMRPLIKSNMSDQHHVFLPKNRTEVARLIDVYFNRLNLLRPVFGSRADFDARLGEEYAIMDEFTTFNRLRAGPDNKVVEDDPGFLCSFYLILALSRMAEIAQARQDAVRTDLRFFPVPAHFFTRAVNIKPELRVTISSLQALILLQWYLYTERHGRTLWRLVGNLVRLAVELGLHHDPDDSGTTFKPEEAQLRRKLWWIVMIQDRGTSVLLGRPLAISEEDFNTKLPEAQYDNKHFDLGLPITHVQADIVNSLYRPGQLTAPELVEHAVRINAQLVRLRDQLPDDYHFYTQGTDNWPTSQKMVLMSNMTQEQGLTLLKYMIARILLLRAVFTSEELDLVNKRKALKDAIITSHNVIVIHNQLIQFADCAFFVSPIPIHIAAMVIIYAFSQSREKMGRPPLHSHIAREDVSMALRMIPQFRWRWTRRDSNGGHPLMNVIAEKVFGSLLHQYGPSSPPMLMVERHFTEWNEDDHRERTMSLSPTEESLQLDQIPYHASNQPPLPALFLNAPHTNQQQTSREAQIDPSLLLNDWRGVYAQDPHIHLDEAGTGAQDYYAQQWVMPMPEHQPWPPELSHVQNEEWMTMAPPQAV